MHFGIDWDLLGIAPTEDVRAIKSAYARKLKTTRPDDDPDGYQALRETYDKAVRRASALRDASGQAEAELAGFTVHVTDDLFSHTPAGEQLSPGDPDTPIQDSPLPDSTLPDTFRPPSVINAHAPLHDDDLREDGPHAEELARSLHQHWQENGDQALIDTWPSLLFRLQMLPMSEREQAAFWFAEFILQNDDVPYEFALNLTDHFGWGQDFRADALIGSDRAERLQQLLSLKRDVHQRKILYALDNSTHRFADMVKAGAAPLVLLLSVLMRPHPRDTARFWRHSPYNLYRALDPDTATRFANLLNASFIIRFSLYALIVSPPLVEHIEGFELVFTLLVGLPIAWLLMGWARDFMIWQYAKFASLFSRLPDRFQRRHFTAGAIVAAMWLWLAGYALMQPDAPFRSAPPDALLWVLAAGWASLLLTWPEDMHVAGTISPLLLYAVLVAGLGVVSADGMVWAVALAVVGTVTLQIALHIFDSRAARLFAWLDWSPAGPGGWLMCAAISVAAWMALLPLLGSKGVAPLLLAVALTIFSVSVTLILARTRSVAFALAPLLITLLYPFMAHTIDTITRLELAHTLIGLQGVQMLTQAAGDGLGRWLLRRHEARQAA